MEKSENEILYSVLVRAPREAVYEAFTTASGLDGWFTRGSEVVAKPGGHIRFRWRDWGPDRFTGEDGGPVLDANPPSRFVFQWQPDTSDYFTTVELAMEQLEDETLVRVREYGYADTPSGRAMRLHCASGWGQALTLCKFYVEHGIRY